MKVGSTTLFHQLKRLPGFTGRCFPGVQGTHFPDNFVVKIHHRSIKEFSEAHALHFDVIFTVVRRPTDMYASRYFHGFKRKRSAPITKLLENFLSISWDMRTNVNYEPFRDRILEYAGVDILDGKMDRAKGYHIYHGTITQTGQPVRVCILRIDRLKEPLINEIYLELGLPSCPRLHNRNQARNQWYGELYSEFRRALPVTYYEKYKEKDEMIRRLFGEEKAERSCQTGTI
jgi:hypothetical protein